MNKNSIVICFLLLFLFPFPIFAAEQVNTIHMNTMIYSDGSMYIKQMWEGNFEEGTEQCISLKVPYYTTIHDLVIKDQKGTYDLVSDWDSNWGFEEKAYKCGISDTDTGYKIRFGISEYGGNCYSIEYRLDHVIAAYTDMEGVNFRFVNEQMNTDPTNATVEIRLADGTPITDKIAQAWGFGFEGVVRISDGAIIAKTKAPMNTQNYMTLLLGFQPGTLSSARTINDSFETIKKTAFSAGKYSSSMGGIMPNYRGFLLVTGSVAILLILLVVGIKLKTRRRPGKPIKPGKLGNLEKAKNFPEDFGYFREIPNEGNLNATYLLSRMFDVCEDGAIFATGILRLMDLGCLLLVDGEGTGSMGCIRKIFDLKLEGRNPMLMNEYDRYLYTILESIAGEEGILQENDLAVFADQHDKILRNYIAKCEDAGKAYFSQKHCVTCWDSPFRIRYLTSSGKKELNELRGFEKYLKDFSLVAERGIRKVPNWKELLSYATLFGVADQLVRQMQEIYPKNLSEIISYNRNVYTAYSYQQLLYYNMKKSEKRREQMQMQVNEM
ncbi:MAG: DUF2207 domain-containing protein [Hungatella sp.]